MRVHWSLTVPLLVLVIAFVDWASGPEISTSILYLAPIAIAAAGGPERAGLLVAFVCGLLWLALDLTSRAYTHAAVPYWNGSVRLGIFLTVGWLVERNRRLREAERALARTDLLTGVPNSRAFFETLQREADRARRTGRPIAVAYIDLDNFKQVNDEHGHETGDRVLRVAAGELHAAVRNLDVVARLGGDEFAILLVEADPAQTSQVLERVRARVLDAMRSGGWPVTLSVGAVIFEQPPDDVAAMVKLADARMYEVKHSGKDHVAVVAVPPGAAPGDA